MNAHASLGGFKVCTDEVVKFGETLHGIVVNKENPFHFRECLARVIKILVLHDSSKEVVFMNRPPDILFVDMQNSPDRALDTVRRTIEGTTEGRVDRLDEMHETEMRRPEFRSMVLGFVLLKAKWRGRSAPAPLWFQNRSGPKVKAPFFEMKRLKCETRDGRRWVRAPFETDQDIPNTYVLFSASRLSVAAETEYVTLHLPKLNLVLGEGFQERNCKIDCRFEYAEASERVSAELAEAIENAKRGRIVMTIEYFPFKEEIVRVQKPFRMDVYVNDVKLFHVKVLHLSDDDDAPPPFRDGKEDEEALEKELSSEEEEEAAATASSSSKNDLRWPGYPRYVWNNTTRALEDDDPSTPSSSSSEDELDDDWHRNRYSHPWQGGGRYPWYRRNRRSWHRGNGRSWQRGSSQSWYRRH